jgi:hypothetical protein
MLRPLLAWRAAMRRLPAAALAAIALLVAPGAALAQSLEPGTPTTIQPSTAGTAAATAPGSTTATPTTTVPGATGTTPAQTATTPAPGNTAPAATPPATAPATPAPAPATSTQAAPAAGQQGKGGHGDRAALVALIVLGALVLLVALIWAVARWQGLEPPWWPRVRHSLQELGWRASNTWADFTDWVRIGR